jgi:hypothetical protein
MNKPNILGIARQQLSEAISNFQTLSFPKISSGVDSHRKAESLHR